MVFFSSVKNRSHLFSHQVPKILIHFSRAFRTDADAPHAADAFLKDGVLRVVWVDCVDRAFPGAESASGAVIVASRLQWSTTKDLVCTVTSFQFQFAMEISI